MNTVEAVISSMEEAIRNGDETYTPPAGMSIYRSFMGAVGYTPAEYLRRRRLSVALSRIRLSEWSDAEIAYACGYSSQQAMCREIKTMLGTTAGEYRKDTCIYYFPPYSGSRVCPLTVAKQNIPAVTALHYYGKSLQGLESSAVHTFLSANPTYTGRLFGRDGGQVGSRFRYTLYITETAVDTAGFETGGQYPGFASVMVVTSAPNTEHSINAAWDWLYTHWLPHSCYQYAGENDPTYETTYFEEYLYKNSHPYRLKLYLPAVRSDAFYKLHIEKLTCRILACTAYGADAQNRAGRQLVECLRERYPYLLQKAERFVMIDTDTVSTCGVLCEEAVPDVRTPLRMIEYKNKNCIHMELQGGCDPERVREILAEWAVGNGFKTSENTGCILVCRTNTTATEVYLPVE